jgi:hypothetical protein
MVECRIAQMCVLLTVRTAFIFLIAATDDLALLTVVNWHLGDRNKRSNFSSEVTLLSVSERKLINGINFKYDARH